MYSIHPGRTRRLLAVTTAAALMVTACSSGDDDERAEVDVVDPAGGSTTTTAAPTTGPDDPDDTGSNDDTGGDSDDSRNDQDEDPGALLLIMDSSGSMNSRDDNGDRLIDLGKDALEEVITGLPEDRHVGLRVYGHRYPNDDRENGCTDTELIHPVEPLDSDALLDSIDSYEAQGFTPIGLSLREGADDLPTEGQRSIVLVSDGQETCDTDPCDAAEELADDDIEVVVHTVGFALDMAAPSEADQARSELSCIADTTGGQFVEVEETDNLADTIDDVAREDRTYETEGGELAGAPIPRDADTGELDTPYTDTVLTMETNYYRFEVTPGSEVRGEAIITPDSEVVCDDWNPANWMTATVNLADESSEDIDFRASSEWTTWDQAGSAPLVLHTSPLVMEERDEVWLRVTTDNCEYQPEAELDIEIQVTEVD